jgi:pyruvate/2-oxoglutarate/acetoin dehydrogenase E1 component
MRTVLTKSEDPTIFFGHDRLLDDVGEVPDGVYEIPLGIKRHRLSDVAVDHRIARVSTGKRG